MMSKKQNGGCKVKDIRTDKILIYKDLVKATDNELQRQLIRKEHLENRTGFILALWGIIMSSFLNMILTIGDKGNRAFFALVVITILVGILSFVIALISIWKTVIYRYRFGEITNKYMSQDKGEEYEVFIEDSLSQLVGAWQKNEMILREKASMYCWSLSFLMLFGLGIIACVFIGKTVW